MTDTVDQLSKIKELMKLDFKAYATYTIKEVYKDKWVYLVGPKDERVEKFEYVIRDWEDKEAKRIEIAKAKSGNSDIVAYFKHYGVMRRLDESYKTNPKCYPFGSMVIYDGKPTPSERFGSWNSEIYFMSLSVSRGDVSRSYGRNGFTNSNKLSLSTSKENCVEASIGEDGVPKIRCSHGWYDKAHKEMKTHYSSESWADDLEKGLEEFMKFADEIYSSKPIQVSKNGLMFQKDKNFLTQIGGNFTDRNGWGNHELSIDQMEIIGEIKYRNMSEKIAKIPEFITTTTKTEILKKLEADYRDILQKTGANKPFKYA